MSVLIRRVSRRFSNSLVVPEAPPEPQVKAIDDVPISGALEFLQFPVRSTKKVDNGEERDFDPSEANLLQQYVKDIDGGIVWTLLTGSGLTSTPVMSLSALGMVIEICYLVYYMTMVSRHNSMGWFQVLNQVISGFAMLYLHNDWTVMLRSQRVDGLTKVRRHRTIIHFKSPLRSPIAPLIGSIRH